MELSKKNAIIYGGSGAIGSAVATAFAREGARIHLAGRTRTKLDAVAAAVDAAGVTVVDVLDEAAVSEHAAAVRSQGGSLDVCVNAVGLEIGEQGVPLVELTADEFLAPVTAYVRSAFVTARAAAAQMTGSGVILALSPPMARVPVALAGSFGVAGAAVENLYRQLAAELGSAGVRVACLRLAGIPETATELGSHTRRMWGRAADRLGVPFEELLSQVGAGTSRGPALTVREVAEVAAFLASDRSAGITGSVVNVTAGSTVD